MKKVKLVNLIGVILVMSGCYAMGIKDHPFFNTTSQADYVCWRGAPPPPNIPPRQNPLVIFPNANVFPPDEYGYKPGSNVPELEYNDAYSRYVAACN